MVIKLPGGVDPPGFVTVKVSVRQSPGIDLILKTNFWFD